MRSTQRFTQVLPAHSNVVGEHELAVKLNNDIVHTREIGVYGKPNVCFLVDRT